MSSLNPWRGSSAPITTTKTADIHHWSEDQAQLDRQALDIDPQIVRPIGDYERTVTVSHRERPPRRRTDPGLVIAVGLAMLSILALVALIASTVVDPLLAMTAAAGMLSTTIAVVTAASR